jgi:hypothetical protein
MVSATFALQLEVSEGGTACMTVAPDKRINAKLKTTRYLRMGDYPFCCG